LNIVPVAIFSRRCSARVYAIPIIGTEPRVAGKLASLADEVARERLDLGALDPLRIDVDEQRSSGWAIDPECDVVGARLDGAAPNAVVEIVNGERLELLTMPFEIPVADVAESEFVISDALDNDFVVRAAGVVLSADAGAAVIESVK